MAMIILTWIVAIEHLGIMLLEMFGTPQQQAQAFDMPLEDVKQPTVRVALANQGIYNGMLGVLLIVSFFFSTGPSWSLSSASYWARSSLWPSMAG